MGRASVLQEIRTTRFEEVYDRWSEDRLTRPPSFANGTRVAVQFGIGGISRAIWVALVRGSSGTASPRSTETVIAKTAVSGRDRGSIFPSPQ